MSDIRDLLAEGRIQEALEKLPDTSEAILLKGRYIRNERDKLACVITHEAYQMEHNRIVQAVLQLFPPPPPGGNEPPGAGAFIPAPPPPPAPARKLKVFVSYAHEDEPYLKALDKHLASLKRSERIELWSDSALHAGQEWDHSIKQSLSQADIVLLLISADFMASQYIWEHELRLAMDRHHAGQSSVVPLFIRPCDWHDAPFGKLQGLPRNAEPVGDPNNDSAWTQVAKEIRRLVEKR